MQLVRARFNPDLVGQKAKFEPQFPHLFDLRWFLKCRIKILVVTDQGGGFDSVAGFGLGQVLSVIENDQWPHVVFDFTKAHRQASGTAEVLDNFRFDAHDLGQYDEIWMFGVVRQSDALSESELKAVAQFMDGGGGVFATGDHENLGQAMCARVPRVRSMRRWYYPNSGPNGEPVAPAQTGLARHDTVTDTDPAAAGIQGNQSDDTPQTIRPRWYTAFSVAPVIANLVRYPHPVLCGPNGVITHLPDHMHEGLCEVPANLSSSFTFDGYTTDEYPTVAGHQQKPEVIAWATNTVSNTQYGVLAAYDGHRSDVGRVLVDATWHHWFNINLIGFLAATDPANPAYDPAVVPEWEEIKSYFRNVAAWLARKHTQRCLRNGGWLLVLKNYEVIMTLRREMQPTVTYYWQLGVFARDALGRLASQCQHRAWITDLFELVRIPQLAPNPWSDEAAAFAEPSLPVDGETLENVVLGAAIHRLGGKFAGTEELQPLVDERAEDIEALMREGAAEGAGRLLEEIGRGCESAAQIARRVRSQGSKAATRKGRSKARQEGSDDND